MEILVQDESIFVYDSLVRKKWTAKRVRPTVIITGSHQKTCVFGTLSLDERQIFRQHNRFNEDTVLSYLKKAKRKFHKFIIFLDRADNTIDLERSRGIYQTIAITLNLNIVQKDLLNSMLLKNAGSKEKMIYLYLNTTLNSEDRKNVYRNTIEQRF